MWLCVRAYGREEVNITLRGQPTQCPASFVNGVLHQCSSPGTQPSSEGRYDACSPEGECQCRAPYQRPTNTTYPGLGFEDCSAKVVPLTPSRFAARHGQRAELPDQVHGVVA